MHTVIDSPADWRGPDVAKRTDWIHEFTREEIEIGIDKVHENSYFDCYELAKRNFSPRKKSTMSSAK